MTKLTIAILALFVIIFFLMGLGLIWKADKDFVESQSSTFSVKNHPE